MTRRLLFAALLLLLSVAPASAFQIGQYPCCSHPVYSTPAIDAVNAELAKVSVRLGYIGDFVSLEYTDFEWEFRQTLETVWQRGAVPVINLMSNGCNIIAQPGCHAPAPLSEIAYNATSPRSDRLFVVAEAIRAWGSQGGGGWLLLIPWPEMNGTWTDYAGPAADYKESVGRLHWVLANSVGAPLQYAKLVYAPYRPSVQQMWDYYPGAWTEIVGASTFNKFGCTNVFPRRRTKTSIPR